jgi:hypothetical protein
LWVAPVIDELTGHPGNLTALWRYARGTSASWGWREAASAVLTEIGRLPAWLVGRTPVPQLYASPKLPLWPGLLGVAALAAVTLVAVRRRQTQVLWLATVVVIAAAASALVVERLNGLIFDYLVSWISSVGVVLWIAVGIGTLQAVQARQAVHAVHARRARPARDRRTAGPAVTGALAILAILATASISGTWSAVAAPRFGNSTSPDINHLASAARQWVGTRPAVKIDFGPDPQQFVGTLSIGTGVVLQLERHGISAKVDASWRRPFGASRIVNGPWTGPHLQVGTADESPPGSERLATSGRYVLYALSS